MSKILLVEDDTNLSEIYQARMEAEGYTVVSASDGESALALAAKEKPDLILSDVMMPKISGFEMLDILRNTDGLKHTKVIMLTALGQAEDQARAQSLGADKYLVKSQVTLEDIVSAAQELLGDSQQMLPTPAELAAPTVTAASGSQADDSAVAAVVPEPVQPAPTGPLVATVPAAVPVEPAADMPADAPVASIPVAVTPVAVEPVAVEPQPKPTVSPVAETPPPVAPLTEVLTQTSDADANTLEQPEPQPTPAQEASETTSPSEPAPTVEPVTAEPQPPMPVPTVEATAEAPLPTPALEAPASPETVSQPAEPTVPATPVVAAAPAQPVTTPTPAMAPQPEAPATAASIDEKVVSNAIDKLLAKSPVLAGEAAISPGNANDRPHNKIIAPIAHEPAPTLEELLAKEEAKASITSPASVTGQVANGPVKPLVNDEAEAAAVLAKAQSQPKPQASENPTDKDTFDPNSISL